jgi:anti-sigma regulatory factor (Ser/Thr protein kinase)
MAAGTIVRLDIRSALDMLDFVQVVGDHVGRIAGLDDDSLYWVGVAVRESVINAIKHGNANDEQKRVHVEFTSLDGETPQGIAIRVRDEGARLRSRQRRRLRRARKPAEVRRPRHLPHPKLHGRTRFAPRA